VSPHLQVTEPAKVLLDAGEDLPCELMANVLKFQLLQVKASDQQRRAALQVSPNRAHTVHKLSVGGEYSSLIGRQVVGYHRV